MLANVQNSGQLYIFLHFTQRFDTKRLELDVTQRYSLSFGIHHALKRDFPFQVALYGLYDEKISIFINSWNSYFEKQ